MMNSTTPSRPPPPPPPESIRHLYTLRDAPPPCEVQEGESCRILHLNDPHWALCLC